MELFIQIRDGMPHSHPILGDNFRQAYPDIDVNNLPSNFARFERIPVPNIGVYEIYEGVTYEWVGDMVKDVHHIKEMTLEEKIEKQNSVKNYWIQNNGYSSWIFNEETCSFEAPMSYPTDGKNYRWNEETTSWIAVE